jgi:PAS domain S-box-containing protein
LDSASSNSAGAELKRSDAGEVYERLFHRSGVGLYETDPEGRFLRANKSLAEMLGWPSAEALLAEIADMGAIYLETGLRARMLALAERDGQTQFLAAVRRRDGSPAWVSETVTLARGPDGRPGSYFGSMTDVGELVRLREAPAAVESGYRDLVENASEGIYRSDAKGRILRANPAFVRLLGYRSEQEMMASINDKGFRHYVEASRPFEFRRQIALSGRLSNFESEIVRVDGERIWVSENARVVRTPSGEVLWYEGSMLDITDRRQAEARLRQAQLAAERANQAKTRFLAAASHDLRQPYQAMRLLLHALACRQTDPQSQALARRLDEAMTTGENLLNALLDISTLEGGTVRPHLASFSIGSVLARLHGEFAPQAAARGQTLRFISSTAGVRSDPVLLERILRNLVLNSIRHSPGGRILVGCRRAGDLVRLEVWDTGPGIPKEKLDEIFEEFAQLGNDERDSSRGHGLGLAIVKGLSRVLGHQVSVRSVVGRGTMFSVAVPAATEPAALAEADIAGDQPGTERSPGARRSVLVIEDEPAQRMSLALLLEDWGYSVRSAADLSSALRELEASGEPPSFVVSDFRLPGGCNGVEAIREIGRHVGRRVPGIILTGDTDPARLREARQSGCILMHKPVSLGSFKHAVASLSGPGDRT